MILKEIFDLHNQTNIHALEDFEGVSLFRRTHTNRFSYTDWSILFILILLIFLYRFIIKSEATGG